MDTRNCRTCNKNFQPKNSVQAYCSKACRKSIRSSSEWKWNRAAALHKAGYKCSECQATGMLHVHHIMPLYLGGSHKATNLQVLCPPCHYNKHRSWPAPAVVFLQEVA